MENPKIPARKTLNANMTLLTRLLSMNSKAKRSEGFTLIELLIASAIAALVSTVTWNILIRISQGDARFEFRRRQHENWKQTSALLQSEISNSESVEGNNLSAINVPNQCPLLQHTNARIKLRLQLRHTLPKVLYGIRHKNTLSDENQWIGDSDSGVLIRCGPKMRITGNRNEVYLQGSYQETVILDNLDLSQNGGLSVSQKTNASKAVKFELAMAGIQNSSETTTSNAHTISSGASARIERVPHPPSDMSVCESICLSKNNNCGSNTKTLLFSDPRFYITPEITEPKYITQTICTNRDLKIGDGMEGITANYVMDGNPTPYRQPSIGVQLIGGQRRNILLGTPSADALYGGPMHDGLIGRGGDDTLIGDCTPSGVCPALRDNNYSETSEGGYDSFLPWSDVAQETSTVKIYGGGGFDRVYLKDYQSTYILSSVCNSSSCTVTTSKGGELVLNNVEQLVFKASNRNL